MRKVVYAMILIVGLTFPNPLKASERFDGILPDIKEVFAVSFFPASKESKTYFTKESFLKIYSSLQPADVRISGQELYAQTGVIVFKDKRILLLRIFSEKLIRIDSEEGTFYLVPIED